MEERIKRDRNFRRNHWLKWAFKWIEEHSRLSVVKHDYWSVKINLPKGNEDSPDTKKWYKVTEVSCYSWRIITKKHYKGDQWESIRV